MKCLYCLEDASKCLPKDCPDKVQAGPARDRAMASWGAGRFLALMGEVLPRYKLDDPYFVRGYNTGAIKRDEDAAQVLLDDDFQPADMDDPGGGRSS